MAATRARTRCTSPKTWKLASLDKVEILAEVHIVAQFDRSVTWYRSGIELDDIDATGVRVASFGVVRTQHVT